jgi:3-hydroxyacyl-CoA dehydrogenase/enoyl-CoA hydratase/3-hydroxybutyryl-CoA epimerase
VEEGIVTDPREADLGTILGFGFAPYTGGALSYIDTMGAKAFVDMCKVLARKYGKQFKAPKLLVEMAEKGETFYGRFNPYLSSAMRSPALTHPVTMSPMVWKCQ